MPTASIAKLQIEQRRVSQSFAPLPPANRGLRQGKHNLLQGRHSARKPPLHLDKIPPGPASPTFYTQASSNAVTLPNFD
jgi:hypothetical protein